MIRGILFTAIVVGAAVIVIRAVPDLARYLKIRKM
jgi:hypothetical protein